MKLAYRRKCTANMHAVNEENGATFASVTRIGLVATLCEGALLAPHTYSGTMKASLFEKWFEDRFLKNMPKEHVIIKVNAAFHKKEVLQNLAENTRRD